MAGINIYISRKKAFKEPEVPGFKYVPAAHFLSISFSKPYPHYPLDSWETDEFVFVVEGYFYEWPDYRKRLEDLARNYRVHPDRSVLLRQFFFDVDAEFLVVVYDKKSETAVVINDIIGRLPLYLAENGEDIIVSRNIGYINAIVSLTVNEDSAFEMLCMGCSYGSKTLYNEVSWIGGGSYFEIDAVAVRKGRYHEFNYEELINSSLKPADVVDEALEIFVKGIKNRSRFAGLCQLGLSGGLDSRAVAAGFRQAGLPCEFTLCEDIEGLANRDIPLAEAVANAHGRQLAIFKTSHPDRSELESLFNEKLGLAPLDMAFIQPFYKWLATRSPQAAYFSGDAGHILKDLRPKTIKKDAESIVRFFAGRKTRIARPVAARLLGRKDDIFERTYALMSTYPEGDWELKYVRFIFENLEAKRYFENHDKVRGVLPMFAPFYNLKLYRLLMSLPSHHKKDLAFYLSFLKRISPETCSIADANHGFAISDRKRVRWLNLRQTFKHTGPGQIIKALFFSRKDNYMHRMTADDKQIFGELLADGRVARRFDTSFLQNLKYFDNENFMFLLTIMKAFRSSLPEQRSGPTA